MSELTKSALDRLGNRLRSGSFSDDDLRSLDQYRRSFGPAYEHVVATIAALYVEPTGRPAKSTSSVVDKLRRESIRLSQIQDIAGCRLVVPGVTVQIAMLGLLCDEFPDATVIDRRDRPSHGYRAVHVVVRHADRWIEIQLRTTLQQQWAELSEKLADAFEPAVKYGGGPSAPPSTLNQVSSGIVVSHHGTRECDSTSWGAASRARGHRVAAV